jgi:hypothetical protein
LGIKRVTCLGIEFRLRLLFRNTDSNNGGYIRDLRSLFSRFAEDFTIRLRFISFFVFLNGLCFTLGIRLSTFSLVSLHHEARQPGSLSDVGALVALLTHHVEIPESFVNEVKHVLVEAKLFSVLLH